MSVYTGLNPGKPFFSNINSILQNPDPDVGLPAENSRNISRAEIQVGSGFFGSARARE